MYHEAGPILHLYLLDWRSSFQGSYQSCLHGDQLLVEKVVKWKLKAN